MGQAAYGKRRASLGLRSEPQDRLHAVRRVSTGRSNFITFLKMVHPTFVCVTKSTRRQDPHRKGRGPLEAWRAPRRASPSRLKHVYTLEPHPVMESQTSPQPFEYRLTLPEIARPATQKPPRNIELRQLAHFRRLRSRIHEGPFHAVLGGRSARVEKTTPIAAAPRYDAFEGMPSYTQKYIKQRRRIPRLDSRTYSKDEHRAALWHSADDCIKSRDSFLRSCALL